jgi:hypothetical protein
MVADDLRGSPAVPLVTELQDLGFTLSVADDGTLTVQPGSRLTADQRQRIIAHKTEIIAIVQGTDEGVRRRCEVFRRQLAAVSPPAVPALLFVPDIPYAQRVCFSCGDPNGRPTFGRCWRCSLAMRLVLGLQISPIVAEALEDARVVA